MPVSKQQELQGAIALISWFWICQSLLETNFIVLFYGSVKAIIKIFPITTLLFISTIITKVWHTVFLLCFLLLDYIHVVFYRQDYVLAPRGPGTRLHQYVLYTSYIAKLKHTGKDFKNFLNVTESEHHRIRAWNLLNVEYIVVEVHFLEISKIT